MWLYVVAIVSFSSSRKAEPRDNFKIRCGTELCQRLHNKQSSHITSEAVHPAVVGGRMKKEGPEREGGRTAAVK